MVLQIQLQNIMYAFVRLSFLFSFFFFQKYIRHILVTNPRTTILRNELPLQPQLRYPNTRSLSTSLSKNVTLQERSLDIIVTYSLLVLNITFSIHLFLRLLDYIVFAFSDFCSSVSFFLFFFGQELLLMTLLRFLKSMGRLLMSSSQGIKGLSVPLLLSFPFLKPSMPTPLHCWCS